MSKLEVNAVEPQCGTNLTLGASGDTIIIPSGATISNQGTAAGFGPTGAVSWDTTKITADPNPAVSGVGYFADTTSAAFTITLPSSPSAGAVVGIADYANTFATNNITVDRNGSNIGGVAADGELSTNGLSVTFIYVDATQGWIVTDSGNRSDLPAPQYVAATGGTVTCCGDYKIHTFTGPGTFTVTGAGNPFGSSTVDYLVVAGGGGGGGRDHGGGGGAGGFRESSGAASGCYTRSPLGACVSALPVSATTYPITVGGGGAGFRDGCASPNTYGQGTSGSNSTFSSIISTGGGGGSANCFPTGLAGGSGGGGSSCNSPSSVGAGNTPPVSPPQGNPGTIAGYASPNYGHSAGGGATSSGTAGTPSTGGQGGNGATTSISASPTTYAGGGGGSTYQGGNLGAGGPGGGGNGTIGGPAPNATNGTAGTANTGGGGGGGERGVPDPGGKAGGSGIVIIRYKFQN
jgi:hypothetical protein